MSEREALFQQFFSKTLVIDIETVSIKSDFEDLDERFQKHWSAKSAILRKYNPDLGTDEDSFKEKAGIYAEFGKIICFSLGRFVPEGDAWSLVVKNYYEEDEAVLLKNFLSDIGKFESRNPVIFSGHNIKEFDLPYIGRRSLAHGLGLPRCLNLSGVKSWNNPHCDTLDLWRFGDYKHYVSLDLLASIFDVPSSKTDIDGSMVSAVYWNKENGIEKIAKYCAADVFTTAQILIKLKNLSVPLQLKIV